MMAFTNSICGPPLAAGGSILLVVGATVVGTAQVVQGDSFHGKRLAADHVQVCNIQINDVDTASSIVVLMSSAEARPALVAGESTVADVGHGDVAVIHRRHVVQGAGGGWEPGML